MNEICWDNIPLNTWRIIAGANVGTLFGSKWLEVRLMW